MKHSIVIFTIAALLLHPRHAAAQDSLLTLQKAIDMGIKNSKQLKISKARIDEAIAGVKEAKDNRLPDLKLSGSYLRLNSAKVDLKSSGSNANSGGPSISQAVYGMANLSLPLYAGGRIRYGIESANYLEQATKLEADNDREAVALNITRAYVNLYKAGITINLVKGDLLSALTRDSMLINLEKNGLLARNDLLKAQLQTSNIELTLMDAESNYKMASVNMNLLLGQPEDTPLKTDSGFISEKLQPKAFLDYETMALQNRKDIKALGFRIKSAATAIKSAKAQAYPTIGLSGGYIAADIPHFVTITNAVNIGIGIQYNLASLWKTNTKLLLAKARQEQVSTNAAMLEDAIRLQVNQDYQDYQLKIKKIDIYEKTLAQANENFRITSNKFNNNLVTVTELLDADLARLQANLDIALAKADAVMAYKKLLHTTGTLN